MLELINKKADLEDIKYYEDALYCEHKEKRDLDFIYPNNYTCLKYSEERECEVIYYNNKKIGYLSYIKIDDYVNIKRVYVDRDYRLVGVGTQIVKELLNRYKDLRRVEIKTYLLGGYKLFNKLNFNLFSINLNGSLQMELEK